MFHLFIFPALIIAAIAIYFTVVTRWVWLALIAMGIMASPNEAIFCVIVVSMIKWLPVLYKRY
jgi:hypothetical protein